jgi:hypothetical protein
MNELVDSIEKARLAAAEAYFETYHGGSYPYEEEEQEQEEDAQGLVFVGRTFENVPRI